MPAVEGWTFVLFACGRLVTKQHALQSRDVANVTRLAVRVAAAVIRANASPRAVELCAWILGGLAKSVSGCVASFSDLRTGEETGDATQILSEAFDGVLCASRSNSPSVTRGACVAAMRLAETNAAAVASGRFRSRARRLAGRVPVRKPRVPAAARAAPGQSPSPPSSPEAWPPSQRRARARERGRRGGGESGDARGGGGGARRRGAAARVPAAFDAPPFSAALDLGATESVHAGLALYDREVETNVTVEASLAASRRALAALAPGDEDSLAGKRALRDAVFPAVASAVEAARLARPVFACRGFGTDASESGSGTRVRRKSVGSLRGTSDILAAAAALVRAVAKSSPDVETFADAARLAARAYAADPERHYHFLAVCVDACVACADAASDDASVATMSHRRHIESIDAMRGIASELSLAVLRVAFSTDNSQEQVPRIPARAEARVAAYAAAPRRRFAPAAPVSARRAGFTQPRFLARGTSLRFQTFLSLPCSRTSLLLSLRSETSGEEALAALALAADVAGAASALAPARFAPGRVDEHARAAAVHPGWAGFKSAMRAAAPSRGSNLPEWAAGMERSRALAETAAETLAGGDVVAFDSSSRRAVGVGEEVSVFEEDAGRSFGARLLPRDAALRVRLDATRDGHGHIRGALRDVGGGAATACSGRGSRRRWGGQRWVPAEKHDARPEGVFRERVAGDVWGRRGRRGRRRDRTSPREASPEAKMDPRRFRRCVKAFCGGRKWVSSGVFITLALDYRARSNVSRGDVESDATDVSERVPAIARKVLFSRGTAAQMRTIFTDCLRV